MKIKLLTLDGTLVKEAVLPPFQILPEIVQMGDRHFVQDDIIWDRGLVTGVIYRQKLTYVLSE